MAKIKLKSEYIGKLTRENVADFLIEKYPNATIIDKLGFNLLTIEKPFNSIIDIEIRIYVKKRNKYFSIERRFFMDDFYKSNWFYT
jgi:hypothetical protein